MRSKLLILIAAAVLVAAAVGYYVYLRPQGPAPAATAAAPPPPEVGVVEVQPRDVPLSLTYSGRVSGFQEVEIRPQVSGILTGREFAEGSVVEEGQPLFRIDPRTYETGVARGTAQTAQAEATLRQATENFRRIEELARRGVATDKQLDDARAARDQAQAAVQIGRAEVRAARLNLEYTSVTAPVKGITRLTSPAIGSLVQAEQTVLTTVTQLDPAYVTFAFTDAEYQRFRALNARRATPITERDITVSVLLDSQTVYPHDGRIDVSARAVDPQTGTITARAILPNPEAVLLPGQFVRVVVRGVTLPAALVVPQQAVSQGPQGPFVYAVDANGTAQARPVRLGREVEGGWVVEQGVAAGDRIVTDGVIRVRPGTPVRVAAAPPAPTPAAQAPRP